MTPQHGRRRLRQKRHSWTVYRLTTLKAPCALQPELARRRPRHDCGRSRRGDGEFGALRARGAEAACDAAPSARGSASADEAQRAAAAAAAAARSRDGQLRRRRFVCGGRMRAVGA